jgi:hypothetical protein
VTIPRRCRGVVCTHPDGPARELSYAELMRLRVFVLAAAACLPASADSQFLVRQMTRGDVPPGKGQCDIRLQVDGEVEAAVRGDTVFLRTLSGREARDDGSECSLPLPNRELRGFAFEVKDKRNQIRLAEQPNPGNHFAVVVRILDTAGGYGRYHFRLLWTAGGEPAPGAHSLDGPAPGPDDRRSAEGFVWNNVTHYGGRGAGSAVYNDEDPLRLSDVSLDIDRGGRATVSFGTGRGRAMVLNGALIARDGGHLKIDAVAVDGRLHGTLSVAVAERTAAIRSLDMEATDGHDRMRLRWEAR